MSTSRSEEPKKVKITDEIRAKLLGFSVMSSNITLPFKVELEGVPDEFLPIFKVKTLTVTEAEDIKSKTNDEDALSEVLRTHILGWSNLYDISTDKPVPFKAAADKGCSIELYSKLPQHLKVLILTFITSISPR